MTCRRQTQRPPLAGVIVEGTYRLWHQPLREVLARRRYPMGVLLPLAAGVMWLLRSLPRFDRVEQAGRLACPLLVLHGSADNVCPYAAGEQIAAAAPDARLVCFEGGGHLDMLRRWPERYEAEIAAFFERVRVVTPVEAAREPVLV